MAIGLIVNVKGSFSNPAQELRNLGNSIAYSPFYNRLPFKVAHPFKSMRASLESRNQYAILKAENYLERSDYFTAKGNLVLAEKYCNKAMQAHGAVSARAYLKLHRIYLAFSENELSDYSRHEAYRALQLSKRFDGKVDAAYLCVVNSINAANQALLVSNKHCNDAKVEKNLEQTAFLIASEAEERLKAAAGIPQTERERLYREIVAIKSKIPDEMKK